MPKISVIIPVFNAEKYICETVKSVLEQTFVDFELILVNDGSTDNSGIICRRFANQDSRIIVLEQSNKGVSAARNLGKEKSSGEYLIFVDADDLMSSVMLEQLYSQAISADADVSICGVKKVSEAEVILLKNELVEKSPVTIDRNQSIKLLCLEDKIEIGAWNKLFKSQTIKEVVFIEGKRINEDKYFVFQALMQVNKVVYSPAELYYYIVRGDSATKQAFSNRWFDSLYFARSIYSELMNNTELEEVARYQLLLAYYTVLRRVYPYREKYKNEYKEIIQMIKQSRLSGILKYMSKQQVFGLLSVKYCIVGYKLLRLISERTNRKAKKGREGN